MGNIFNNDEVLKFVEENVQFIYVLKEEFIYRNRTRLKNIVVQSNTTINEKTNMLKLINNATNQRANQNQEEKAL